MPVFEYQQRDRAGKIYQGQLEAVSLQEAATKLRDEGMYLISIRPLSETKTSNKEKMAFGKKVKTKDLLLFTRQFSVMIRAGLNINSCLNLLSQQVENPFLAGIITQIKRGIEGGESLSVVLGRHPQIFPPIYVYMIEAGEASGKLDVSLDRLYDYLERQFTLKKKVVGALVYPGIICFVAVMVVTILMVFVLPTFGKIFADAGIELPTITKILIGTGVFCQQFWFLIPLIPALIIMGYKMMQKSPEGRETLDKFWLKFPLVGDLILKLAVARFTRTFATLLESGVEMLQGLKIVERAVGNAVVGKSIRDAAVNVNRGTGLAQPLQASGVFPVMVAQMVSIGEDTGELSTMLETVADYYDKEVEYTLANLTAMIEPMIIVALGGIVAFIVASIFIPMFDLSSGATLK